jgi:hypothetical protein
MDSLSTPVSISRPAVNAPIQQGAGEHDVTRCRGLRRPRRKHPGHARDTAGSRPQPARLTKTIELIQGKL